MSRQASTPSKKAGATGARPALPLSKLNPHLSSIPRENYNVKYQTIVREDKEIVVGRVKVPTPSGHAFILRRYDTGAFSQTTIFKACFPTASEDEEKAECDWVKASGDNSGANGGKTTDAVRLAGSWVVPDVALETAKTYGVVELIQALAEAHPDPTQAYRKSQRSQAASESLATSTPPSTGLTPASKRSRTIQTTRRSASPAVPPPAYTPLPAAGTQIEVEVDVPKQAVDDAEEAIARREQAEAEVEEAKRLVAELKKQEEAKKAALVDLAQEAVDAAPVEKPKRGIDEVEAEQDDDKEETDELEEGRVIATNSRAANPPPGTAMQTFKQAAWGALVFGVGVGATTILPRFFF